MNKYLKQFSVDRIETIPFREEGFYWYGGDGVKKVTSPDGGKLVLHKTEKPEHGRIKIKYEAYEISLELPSFNSIIPNVFLEDAKSALSNLPAWLRLLEEKNYLNRQEEDLAWIFVREDGVELHFVGIKVNDSYGVIFEKNERREWILTGPA